MNQAIKKLILFILIVSYGYPVNAQRDEITLNELFRRIENTQDTNVYLKNLYVVEDDDAEGQSESDDHSGKIVIDKNVRFENVVFEVWKLANLRFRGNVEFINTVLIGINNSVFEKNLIVKIEDGALLDVDHYSMEFSLSNSKFYGNIDIQIGHENFSDFGFVENEILYDNNLTKVEKGIGKVYKPGVQFIFENIYFIQFSNNIIKADEIPVTLIFLGINSLTFTSNSIANRISLLRIDEVNSISLFDNEFLHPFILSGINIKSTDYVKWTDFQHKFVSLKSYQNNFSIGNNFEHSKIDSLINDYVFKDEFSYNHYVALLGRFSDFYKSQHNQEWGNLVFQDIKDLQTKRLEYLYQNDRTFSNYFRLKVNQFLKIFSDYGTRPSKAIIISIYVIFIFAFFYFFFPNSWDADNKHRIMNRLLFFAKYFKRKEGMKEVFEEENKSKVMAYEDFKNYMEESKSEVPPYFIALTKPIFVASVANYRLRSKILSKTDILKGKWTDLNPRRKAITSIIMAFWLFGILLYDLFVKFFNALMLSINTFSTLGFGEIPIKGIPRYLAILQGFLGWFLLSIFSVSLISQLLN